MSLPKGVWLAALLDSPREIAVHNHAVRTTLQDLKTFVEPCARRDGNVGGVRPTGNPVAACFAMKRAGNTARPERIFVSAMKEPGIWEFLGRARRNAHSPNVR